MENAKIKRIVRRITKEIKSNSGSKLKEERSDENMKLDNMMEILEKRRMSGKVEQFFHGSDEEPSE
ncbi:hypothetical protein AKJ37_04860 [candidate division MSBL1 archaeon SCGC-AAA259I09]|uniref:Uncharacterized protein n=1 Tax=candidate division MSBL1 archaeon SCGC-AAA259I09 TaxID=1698267 RepID=A0A133UR30_9EURY|nr:hypothetical protein AKJ37_04860 [candidate division MSBL1 archaeon SCGC-AAA259I09]